MDRYRDSKHHHSAKSPSPEELYEMWQDPNRYEEALSYISPKQLRKGIREVAEEEAQAAKHGHARREYRHDEPGTQTEQQRETAQVRKDRAKTYGDFVSDGLPAVDDRQAQENRLQQEYLERRNNHPGYAPHSKFAPPVPNSPAYDTAYNQPKPEFYGLDIGLVRLGVNSNGSLDVGVNVGVAKAGVQVGLENRVEGEFMPIGGPLHARAGAGIGVNRNGLHSEVGAGANFFNAVNGDADFGVRVGRDIGVDGDVRGRAFPVNAQADAGASVGPDGVNAYTGANTDIAGQAGVRAGAHFDVDRYNSGVGAGVGIKAGDRTFDFGPSINSDGNRTVRPDLHLDPGFARRRTFYPTGDRYVDEGQR